MYCTLGHPIRVMYYCSPYVNCIWRRYEEQIKKPNPDHNPNGTRLSEEQIKKGQKVLADIQEIINTGQEGRKQDGYGLGTLTRTLTVTVNLTLTGTLHWTDYSLIIASLSCPF